MESNNNGGSDIGKLAAAGGLFAGGLGILELLSGGNWFGNRGNCAGAAGAAGLQGIMDLAILQSLMGNGGNCGSQKDAIIADLSARLAGKTSEEFAQAVGIATYEKVLARMDKTDAAQRDTIKSILEELVRMGKEEVRNEERYNCLKQQLEYGLRDLRREFIANDKELAHAVEIESERRATADSGIREWTDCNFVRNKKVIPTENLCPKVRLADGSVSGENTINVRLITDQPAEETPAVQG